MPPGVIRAKTYQGIQVHELSLDTKTLVMRRVKDGYVNATHILKVAGLEKAERTKILEKEIVLLSKSFEKVQGGYGKYQGTWVPLEEARGLAQKYDAEAKIRALLDLDGNAVGPFTIEEIDSPVNDEDASQTNAKSSRSVLKSTALKSSTSHPPLNNGDDEVTQSFILANPAVALNVRGAMTRRRAKMGLEGIDPEEAVPKQAATSARKRVRFPPGLVDPTLCKPTCFRVPQKLKAAAKRNQRRSAAQKRAEETDTAEKSTSKKAAQRGGKEKEETPPPPSKKSLFEKRKELIVNTIMDSKVEVNQVVDLLMARWPEPKKAPPAQVSPSKKQLLSNPQESSVTNSIPTPKKKRMSWRVALDKNGRTAGHYAARYGKWRIVRGLIQRNTTANITTFDGANYLMSAVSHPSCRLNGCFKKMLDVIGNTYEHADKKGRTVLHRLARASGDCRHERREAAVFYTECMISHFPNPPKASWVNSQDSEGRTALHLACQGGNRRMVELLITELLADHTIQDLDGAVAADLSSTWALTEFLMRTGVINMPKNPEIEAFMKRRMNPIVIFDEDDDGTFHCFNFFNVSHFIFSMSHISFGC
ncbi:hypothetical protein BJ742DRAFT_221869 [Cladochytrium replicatum]|nr:hypothetical protein BJ742DRAFT_221869 [Cladochytrium replicatum]